MAHLSFGMAQALATGVAMVGNFALNSADLSRPTADRLEIRLRLVTFSMICSVGAIANVGIATVLFTDHAMWWIAGLAGAAMSAVWNYAMTSALTWRTAGP